MSDDGVQRDKYDFERQQSEMISTLVRLAVPLWKAQMRLQKDGDEPTSIARLRDSRSRPGTALTKRCRQERALRPRWSEAAIA
jgi:hypothetical protein